MQPAVITVGRMNPPTRGHAVLVRKVLEIARETGAQPILYLVDGEQTGKDKIKNPLTGAQREAYVKQMFPGIKVDVVTSAYQVIDVLEVQGMMPAIWVAGSDRASNYRKMLIGANLKGQVVEVDREAGEADGVSATAARQAALDGDMESFRALMPDSVSLEVLANVMEDIREAQHGSERARRTGSTSQSNQSKAAI